jgi:branched-chain amino acid transport system ATP-binding protein
VQEKTVSILIGPNGSGKTTLINVISGFYKPDGGKVQYASTDITGWPPHSVYNAGLARTFQIPALFTKLTVLENLLVAEKKNPGESFSKSLLRKLWVRKEEEAVEKAVKILKTLGLMPQANTPAYLLSGGQMKLLEMGRALMSDSKLLLLDEPVSGVNPTLAHEIFTRIIKLRDEAGISFFIVEHRLDIAMKYVDHMTAMALGKVIASGHPDKVVADAKVVESYLGD